MVTLAHDQRGGLSLPLAWLLVAAATATLGGIGVLRLWHKTALSQLTFDECVGKEAHALRNNLRRTAASARRLDVIRAAIAVAMATQPEAVPALKVLAQTQVLLQQTLEIEWGARNALWTPNFIRCGAHTPHPPFPWKRLPPDPIGPGALRWAGPQNHQFRIQTRGRLRSSAAWVRENSTGTREWIAEWATVRPSLD